MQTPPFDDGDRIRLVSMPDDPNPIPVGSEGTVIGTPRFLDESWWQVDVDWDNGRTLCLTVPPDQAVKIGKA